ncbi:MAG: protein-tyrosine kinase [Planctomycetota bacterium]|nr:MAG: protein-tyrosine kinase [Planctomycetota bacterium]
MPAAAMGLRHWIAVLLARRWAVLGSAAASIALGALVSFSQVPQYRATALLLIEPQRLDVTGVQEPYDPTLGQAQDYLQTQQRLLRSRRVAELALRALRAEPELSPGARRALAALTVHRLQEQLEVTLERNTRLVRVSFEAVDPLLAAAAANAVVEQFIEDSRARTAGVSKEGLESLRRREQDLRGKLEQAQIALHRFETEQPALADGMDEQVLQAQLAVLNERLAEVQTRRTAAAVALAPAHGEQAQPGAGAPGSEQHPAQAQPPGPPAELLATEAPLVQQLLAELHQREAELAELLARYRPTHPYLAPLRARLERLRQAIQQELQAARVRAQARLRALVDEEAALQRAISQLVQRLGELRRHNVQRRLLQDNVETLAASYKALLKRIEELELAAAASDSEHNLFLIERAEVPAEPVRPRPVRDLVLAALLGLLVGLGLALALESLDDSVKAPDEVQAQLGLPVLATLPPVRSERSRDGQDPAAGLPELLAVLRPDSRPAEVFRQLVASLRFVLTGPGPRVLLVSSVDQAEGKTFACIGLASALARAGERVLLIDADLRRPRLQLLLGEPSSSQGLSTLLASLGSTGPQTARAQLVPGALRDGGGWAAAAAGAGPGGRRATAVPVTGPAASALERTLAELVVPGPIAELDLLPAGPVPPNPGELLGSGALDAVLAAASSQYRWVLIDSAPLRPVADTLSLLAHVPELLLVVRAFRTSRRALRRVLELVHRTPVHLAGVVLNNADAPRLREEGYGYDYGYGRGAGNQGARPAPAGPQRSNAARWTSAPAGGGADR